MKYYGGKVQSRPQGRRGSYSLEFGVGEGSRWCRAPLESRQLGGSLFLSERSAITLPRFPSLCRGPGLLPLSNQVTTMSRTFSPSLGNLRSAKPRPMLIEAIPQGDPPFQVSSGPSNSPVPAAPLQPTAHLRPRGTSVGSPLRVLEKRCFMEPPPTNFCLLRLAEMAVAHGLQLIHLSRGDCHSA